MTLPTTTFVLGPYTALISGSVTVDEYIQVRKEDRIRLLHPFHAIQKAGLPIRLSERPVLENSPDAVAGDRIGKPPTYIFPRMNKKLHLMFIELKMLPCVKCLGDIPSFDQIYIRQYVYYHFF